MSRRVSFDRLDLGMGLAVTALFLLIGLTLVQGDRVGVGIVSVAPPDTAPVTSVIQITFNELMDTASVERRLEIAPPLEGAFSWNGVQITYRPGRALMPGTTYTVTLGAGATSANGRQLTEPKRWTFTVAYPRLAYLSTGETDSASNIWIVDPRKPFESVALTQNTTGINDDFRPSPDGARIAFSMAGPRGTADLYMVEVSTGATRRLTSCVAADARCQGPDWSPDGTRIVYERTELSAQLAAEDRNLPRAWLLNLRDLSTAPLLANTQFLGSVPHWSPNGRQIAVFDINLGAIAVYDIASGEQKIIQTLEGGTGAFTFDPTGTRLVYPQLSMAGGRFTSRLEMVYLNEMARGIRALTVRDNPAIEDKLPAWQPGSDRLAITRRILDGSGPTGTDSAQVYWLEAETGKTEPLVIDGNYFHGAISWDPTGNWLAMQRLAVSGNAERMPGIWVYEVSTGKLWQVAKKGFLPRWLP